MKAMRLDESGTRLVSVEASRPVPTKGEVLILVHAAGITPTELLWDPTFHTREGTKRTGAILSHEFSGEVAEIGDEVAGLAAGDAIYGLNDWFAEGALAEYCVTRPEWIAPRPQLSDVEAATVPISALTAWQGLFDHGHLEAGERVLIHGGTGAVGLFATQLAHRHGAYVIATASGQNATFARELGADEVIDYTTNSFENQVKNVDLVFDTVGRDTLTRSWSVLSAKGRVVTIAADSEGASDSRVKSAFFIVETNRSQLMRISELLNRGELRCFVDAVVTLTEASRLYDGSIKKGRGKSVVKVL